MGEMVTGPDSFPHNFPRGQSYTPRPAPGGTGVTFRCWYKGTLLTLTNEPECVTKGRDRQLSLRTPRVLPVCYQSQKLSNLFNDVRDLPHKEGTLFDPRGLVT